MRVLAECQWVYRNPYTETTYRPLNSNHPGTANNFAVLPHRPEGISGVVESQLETVGYLRMKRGFGRLALASERLEVLERGGVLVRWITKYNHI